MKISSIQIQNIVKSARFNASFHLSKAELYERLICEKKFKLLSDLTSDIFTGGRSKRNYSKPNNALPFLGNTDISSINPLDGCKFVSKKYWSDKKSLLKEGMILTGRVGQNTVGAFSYTNKVITGCIGSDNVIRIISNNIVQNGFLYSYLTSKYGYEFARKHISGNAQPFITEEMLGTIPVPIFSNKKQEEIHNFIVQAANLRVDASKSFKDAIKIFENEIGISEIDFSCQSGSINIKNITSFQSRFDSQFQLINKKLIKEKKSNIKYKKISELASNIHVGNRGKRNYVANGIPFLSSSDMMLFNPKRYAKQISPKTIGINNLLVKQNTILISRSGTVGNTIIVGEDLANTAVSEHALRLEINASKIDPLYVYCYLNTTQGKKQMEAAAFGSVIITLNEELIGNIEIPILDKSKIESIVKYISSYQKNIDLAVNHENQAIQQVETEIEQWQQ